jgi:hypothetical protein
MGALFARAGFPWFSTATLTRDEFYHDHQFRAEWLIAT